jgi:MoxR-like ATPase
MVIDLTPFHDPSMTPSHSLTENRVHVSYEDVERVLYPALRHRLILNFQAEAENITTDQVIGEVLKHVPKN